MNQYKLVAIPRNLLEAREKSRLKLAIGFGFPSRWLINWREIFKPIIRCSNFNRVITFNSRLKTALSTNSLSWVYVRYKMVVHVRQFTRITCAKTHVHVRFSMFLK